MILVPVPLMLIGIVLGHWLFGLLSSTLLTVLVIPAIYVVLRDDGQPSVR